MRSLLINSPDEYEKYMQKLSEPDGNGDFLAKASITTRIELDSPSSAGGASSVKMENNEKENNSPSGGNPENNIRIFTEEEQLAFIDEILDAFKSINFTDIINYYKSIINKHEKTR